MKKILFAFSVLLAIAACTNKPVAAVENNEESSEVAFEVAKNYFFKNDQVIPEYPKITTEEESISFSAWPRRWVKRVSLQPSILLSSLYWLSFCQ
jgi:hypothetical protein